MIQFHTALQLLAEGALLPLLLLPMTLFADHVAVGRQFGHSRYPLTATYVRLIVVVLGIVVVGGGRLLGFAALALVKTFRITISLLAGMRRTP